eukprot:11380677-Alexandrium_andersonii.AAC.1
MHAPARDGDEDLTAARGQADVDRAQSSQHEGTAPSAAAKAVPVAPGRARLGAGGSSSLAPAATPPGG